MQVSSLVTSTTVSSSTANSSVYGQSVTFSATVASPGGTPSGSVQFQIDGSNFGSPVSLSSGSATSPPVSTLAAGTYTITANFTDGTNFANSSGSLTQTVNKATPTVTVIDAGGVYNGASFPVTAASVQGVAADGVIASFGNPTLSYTYYQNGVALSGPPTAAGTYLVVAHFAGNANYTSADSSSNPSSADSAEVAPPGSPGDPNGPVGVPGYPTRTKSGFVLEVGRSWLANTDTVTSVALASPGAAATAAVAGSPYAITASAAVGTGLGNYTISYSDGKLTVNPAVLTITAKDASKTYGASLSFAGTEFTTSGLLNSDTVTSVTLSSSGAAGAATVASSPYAITASAAVGTGLGNYTISYVNGKLTINPAALTITAKDQNKAYGTTLTFAGTEFTTSGLANTDTVTSVALASPGAAATAAVAGSPYAITPGAAVGTGLGNYSINYINGNLAVNPAALTITAKDASKTYGTALSFAGTEFTVSGLFNSDTVTSVTLASPGTPATATVANSPYAITPSASVGTGLANYTINYVNGKLTVNPAGLTITAKDASKTYGSALTFAGTEFTSSGLLNNDTVTSVALASSGAPATAAVAASPYAITPSAAAGTGLTNYTVSYVNGKLTVNPAGLTITAKDTSKTYGATLTFAGTEFTTSGLLNSDSVTSVTLASPGTAATAAVAGSPYSITPTAAVGTGLTNYTISYANGKVTVNPAALAITAKDASKTYGTTLTFAGTEFTASGLVNSDTVTSVTLTSGGAAATANVSGSPYPITPSAAVGTGLGNYTISYANGKLTVNPAALTITAKDAGKTYGATLTFAGTEFTSSGLLNSDTVTSVSLTSTGAATTATVAGSPYAIAPSAAVGTGIGNYSITYVSGKLAVNPAALTITAKDATKTYGKTLNFAGTEFTTSGLLNSDTVTSVTLASAGANATAAVAGSPYTITPSAAVGTGLANYTITYANGKLTVGPAALTITAKDASKAYGATLTFAGTEFTTSGLLNTDSVTSVTLSSPGAAATAIVAGSPYAITPSAAVGTGLGNYTISYVNGKLVVNPAATSLTETSSVNQPTGSQAVIVTFTAKVSPQYSGNPTGAVTFFDNGTPLGSPVSLSTSGGATTAAFMTGELLPGSHSFTAAYGGDGNFKTSSSTAPTVGAINNVPAIPQPLNTTINPNATLSGAQQSAVWNWGDGVTSSATVSGTSLGGTHTYTAENVNTISLAVSDPSGGLGLSIFQYLVIYSPTGGFVTGGGWITSPAGAYTANPSLTGKASFGFNSGYKPGRSVPDGQTEFQFDVGNLEFHSTAYDFLTITNNVAQYQGTGVINGSGNYKFVLTSVDGDLSGGTGPDKFRIRIWDRSVNQSGNGSNYVYDNYPSGQLYNDPSGTTLGGGEIKIHPSNGRASGGLNQSAGTGLVLKLEQLQPIATAPAAQWQQAGVTPVPLAALGQPTDPIDGRKPGILTRAGSGGVLDSTLRTALDHLLINATDASEPTGLLDGLADAAFNLLRCAVELGG